MYKVDYETFINEPVPYDEFIDYVYNKNIYPLHVNFKSTDIEKICDEVLKRYNKNKLDPKNVFVYVVFAMKKGFGPVADEKPLLDLLEANFLNSVGDFEMLYAEIIGFNNPEKARELFEKAIEKGNEYASCLLANYYIFAPYGNAKDYKKALEICIKEHERSHYPKATYMLANIYLRGIGVDVDLEKAIRLFKEAADKNHPDSIYELARIIDENNDNESHKLAFQLFEKAANLGSVYALSLVTEAYYNGDREGVKYDEEKAFNYARKGFLLRSVSCSITYASCIYQGHGVKPNKNLAKELLIEMANEGVYQAATALALLLDADHFEDKDLIFRLLAKATSMGDEAAVIYLNDVYNNKNYGTSQEYEKAIKAYNELKGIK